MDFLGAAIVASILAFLFIRNYFELLRQKHLFEHVSWCINNANSAELTYYRVNELVPSRYRLNSQDLPFLKVILEAYKNDLSSLYFKKRLLASRNFAKLQSREYFFITLKSYLEEHECDWIFQSAKLYDIIETEYFDGDGTKEFCHLTSDGLTYAKVLHLVSAYCISSSSINSNQISIDSIDYLKQQIDSGTTTISRYRP